MVGRCAPRAPSRGGASSGRTGSRSKRLAVDGSWQPRAILGKIANALDTDRLPSRGRHAVSERDNLVLRLLQRMDRRVRLIGDVVNGVGAIVTGALVYLGVHYFLELSVTISTIIAAVVAGIASAAMRWDFEKGTSRLDKLAIFPRERSTPGEEFH